MNKLTREEALRRWKSSKATKKAMVDKMQKIWIIFETKATL